MNLGKKLVNLKIKHGENVKNTLNIYRVEVAMYSLKVTPEHDSGLKRAQKK